MINPEADEELVAMAKLCQLSVREGVGEVMMPVFTAFDGMLGGWIDTTHKLLDQVGDGAILEKVVIAEYIEFIWPRLGVGGIGNTEIALRGRVDNLIDLHSLRKRLLGPCTVDE